MLMIHCVKEGIKMVSKDTIRKKIDTNYKSGNYLGANYTNDKTRFLIWSPTAEMIRVALYGKDGEIYDNVPERIINMEKELSALTVDLAEVAKEEGTAIA